MIIPQELPLTNQNSVSSSSFDAELTRRRISLRRAKTDILQINVGKLCNLTCIHCHVNAGPSRKEIIERKTIDRILTWLEAADIPTVDLTGGAPEMIPDFSYFVGRLRSLPKVKTIIDRCNLTILLEPGFEWLADVMVANRLEVVASMPCYSAQNVNEQRGHGVFDSSIRALQLLNRLGYGSRPELPLHLVYNPNGAFLPGDQSALEADYKRELKMHFGIVFNRLYTITNMPISRFASWLKRNGKLEDYMRLLIDNFNPASVEGLMCRNTLNVGRQGEVYDCDFNQQLGMQWKNGNPIHLWDVDPNETLQHPISTGEHCFGCTAAAGSSCTGKIV